MYVISINLHLLWNLLQLLFSTLHTASSTIFKYFLVLLLLLKYVKLGNSFCYQVFVEICMFLIIFIFIILSMFVCMMYFFRNYRKKFEQIWELLCLCVCVSVSVFVLRPSLFSYRTSPNQSYYRNAQHKSHKHGKA